MPGVDMDMQGAVYMENLARSVTEGKVDIQRVDAAVKAVLEMKYRLGLFEDPYRYANEAREKATIYKPEFLEAARDVARKSIVLLKNKASALPLAATAKSIAVIGPLANSKEDMIGSWSAAGDRKTRPVTLLEGLQAGAHARNTPSPMPKGASYAFEDAGKTDGLAEAIALAQKSGRDHRRDGRALGHDRRGREPDFAGPARQPAGVARGTQEDRQSRSSSC